MSVPNVGRSNYRSGGTRGGGDQFSWTDVKDEKYRENYLGHSVMAPVGRWQNNKDLTWFNKNKDGEARRVFEAEQARLKDELKRQESELMAQALGLAPDTNYTTSRSITTEDFKHLSERGQTELSDSEDRVGGLGAGRVRHHDFAKPSRRLDADEAPESLPGMSGDQTGAAAPAYGGGTVTGSTNHVGEAADKDKKPKKQKKEKKRNKDKDLIKALQAQLAKDKYGRPSKLEFTMDDDKPKSRKSSRKHKKKKKSSQRRSRSSSRRDSSARSTRRGRSRSTSPVATTSSARRGRSRSRSRGRRARSGSRGRTRHDSSDE